MHVNAGVPPPQLLVFFVQPYTNFIRKRVQISSSPDRENKRKRECENKGEKREQKDE